LTFASNTLSISGPYCFRHSARNRAVAVGIPPFGIPPCRHSDRLPIQHSTVNSLKSYMAHCTQPNIYEEWVKKKYKHLTHKQVQCQTYRSKSVDGKIVRFSFSVFPASRCKIFNSQVTVRLSHMVIELFPFARNNNWFFTPVLFGFL